MQWEALHEVKISPEDRCPRRAVLRILSLTCSYSLYSAPSLVALDSREESRCVKGWLPRAGVSPSVRRSAGACRGSPSWDLARCLCAAVSGQQHPCFSLLLFLFSPQPLNSWVKQPNKAPTCFQQWILESGRPRVFREVHFKEHLLKSMPCRDYAELLLGLLC